tara:strand:- start:152 stop:427 length:276 start_codon:yes stop_codon:yes gene_type:complete
MAKPFTPEYYVATSFGGGEIHYAKINETIARAHPTISYMSTESGKLKPMSFESEHDAYVKANPKLSFDKECECTPTYSCDHCFAKLESNKK